LTVDDITAAAFGLRGKPPTRAQRLSATRAAHRVLRRVREMYARSGELREQARRNMQAALGLTEEPATSWTTKGYDDRLEKDPAWRAAEKLWEEANHIGLWARFRRGERRGTLEAEIDYWCTTTLKGRLWFHPPDVPVRVWAVSVDPHGVIWAEAEVTKVTQSNVMVRYAGKIARLDRRTLWHWWAFWRAVRFVSSRTGRIAQALDEEWHRRYGAAGSVPPAMQMPLQQARALLGVPENYTKEDVLTAFRRTVKKAHPDAGGTAEMFRLLVEARDRLLAALGTKAPPPKPPAYAPEGVSVVYRRVSIRSQRQRLAAATRRLR
jgi:hypothetical protein